MVIINDLLNIIDISSYSSIKLNGVVVSPSKLLLLRDSKVIKVEIKPLINCMQQRDVIITLNTTEELEAAMNDISCDLQLPEHSLYLSLEINIIIETV